MLQVFHSLCYEDKKLKFMAIYFPPAAMFMLFRNYLHFIGIMTEMPVTVN